MNPDAEKALSALWAIPNDLPRPEWHKVGRAAIAAGLTVDDLVEWSRGASNFAGERDVRAAFKTVTPDGGTGAGTLYRIAAAHGWSHKSPTKAPKRPVEAPRSATKGVSPADVWSRCKPSEITHPYIVAKRAAGVPLDGFRVVPEGDPLRIGGFSMAGALVVPAYAPDGQLQSLQFIPPPGAGPKMNLPGAPMAGAMHVVGDIKPGEPIYIVEGIGQAWACWQATGHAAVTAFGWGNVARVAETIRRRYPDARLVLVPDVGKEGAAADLARELGAALARLPQGEADNFDANDYAQREGFDALADLLESAAQPPKPEPLLRPVSVADVLTNPSPPPKFVWDGYLPSGVVTLLGAHGGTGKSTIALMLAVAVATGRPLFDVPTTAAPAVFVSLEDGERIVRHRLANICRVWGIDARTLEGRLHVFDGTQSPELFTAEGRNGGDVTSAYLELSRLVADIGAGLVVVDNVSDGFAGDEINRRQVRAFMRALARLAEPTGCAVCLLAHVDKSTSRSRKAEGGEGYSGSTAWHNSARSRLYLARDEAGLLTLEHQKSNLGRLREPLALAWPEGGLPMLATEAPNFDALNARASARADDAAAAELLRLIAEFEGRGQFASPAPQARNNVHALLRAEPAFQRLKLCRDDVARLVNQCHRAGWLEPVEYRTPDRKTRERWAVTEKGRDFAGLPAPTAPTAPTCSDGAEGALDAEGAPTAAHILGGCGGKARAHVGALDGAEVTP